MRDARAGGTGGVLALSAFLHRILAIASIAKVFSLITGYPAPWVKHAGRVATFGRTAAPGICEEGWQAPALASDGLVVKM